MFGFGNKRARVRNDTFAPNRIGGAALAGVGMLAWRWWRNRQKAGPTPTNPDRTFSESSSAPGGSF